MQAILNYIPQRPPFVMVDSVLFSDETITRTSFNIRAENIFVENGEFKEPGLVENIAQTAAAGAGYFQKEDSPARVGYIGAIKNLEIHGFPHVNDELITEVIVQNRIFDVSVISGKVRCNDVLVAQCEMKIFITNQ